MYKCNNCFHKKVCIDGANYKTAESCKHYVPAADVQEVVRCKDCKYLKADTLDQKAVYFCTQNVFARRRVRLDDYCSYGARMDGDINA